MIRFNTSPDDDDPVEGSRNESLVYLILFTVSGVILFLAIWMEPAPPGQRINPDLPIAECSFKNTTGVPCPSCGYTTASVHMAHGQFLLAISYQPMGAVMFILIFGVFVTSLFWMISGRPSLRTVADTIYLPYLFPLLVFYILAWIYHIYRDLQMIP